MLLFGFSRFNIPPFFVDPVCLIATTFHAYTLTTQGFYFFFRLDKLEPRFEYTLHTHYTVSMYVGCIYRAAHCMILI